MGESIEVKVGQMVLVGMRGVELAPDNPIVRDIRERHIGEDRIDASYQRIMRLKGRLSRGKPAHPGA